MAPTRRRSRFGSPILPLRGDPGPRRAGQVPRLSHFDAPRCHAAFGALDPSGTHSACVPSAFSRSPGRAVRDPGRRRPPPRRRPVHRLRMDAHARNWGRRGTPDAAPRPMRARYIAAHASFMTRGRRRRGGRTRRHLRPEPRQMGNLRDRPRAPTGPRGSPLHGVPVGGGDAPRPRDATAEAGWLDVGAAPRFAGKRGDLSPAREDRGTCGRCRVP